MVSINLGNDGRMVLLGTPYQLKDMIKTIPGRRWAPALKAWTFPRNLRCFELILNLFPDALIEDGLQEEFEIKGTLLAAAMEAKNAPDGTLPLPDNCVMDPPPWHHQVKSFHFGLNRLVANKGAMLALDMGCGKSRVAIELARNLQCGPVLIICPKTVTGWEKQINEYAPYLWPVLDIRDKGGSVAKRGQKTKKFFEENPDRGIVIINKDAAWRKGFAEFALGFNWDMMIVDECHRAKSPAGKYSRFLDRMRRAQPDMKILGLTGTPTPHSPLDIYAQARFIDPSIYGTNFASFKGRYAVFGGYGGYKLLHFQNQEELRGLFNEMAIQVKKRDVLDLPDVTHIMRECELTSEEMAIYREFRDELVVEIREGVVTAANALVKLLRLSQIAQGWVKNSEGKLIQVGNTKEKCLLENMGDLDPNEPVVIFSRFHSDMDGCGRVAEKLDRPFFRIGQGVNEVAEWEREVNSCGPTAPVVSIQVQSGSEGLNELVASRYCIYYSVDWSLGNYDQSLARLDRPGQTRNTTYIHIIAKNTVDVKVYNALSERRDIIKTVFGDVRKG